MRKQRAFTMLELVFVIVILGIVSSIGASVIAKIYENYLIQKSIHNISINTELAAEQIANRLQYSMPMMVVARQPGAANFGNVEELFRATGTDTVKTILEWIAYDNDSFTASSTPGWSGFADLASASANGSADGHSIRTPGSDLNLTNTIMRNLSQNAVGTSGVGVQSPNLIFSGDIPFILGIPDTLYRTTCLGLGTNPATNTCAIPITTSSFANAHDRINFTNATAMNMGEFYKLAWSAYAIVPTNRTDGAFDLSLHSNYQPWLGAGEEYYNAPNKNTLIRNVTVFKFMESAGTLRFKLCARAFITGTTDFVSSCKEKVITR